MASPQHLTQQGTILGTFQYMAPEQLEGEEADARSDIFAFGAVLYEMATGRKAFDGKSQASLIGSILKDNPPPISVDRADDAARARPRRRSPVSRRIRRIASRRRTTSSCSSSGSRRAARRSACPAPVAARRKSRERLAWALAAAAALAALGFAIGFLRRAPAPLKTVRFDIAMPEGVTTIDAPRISPDGRTLAFNATDSTGKSRHLGAVSQRPEGASARGHRGNDAPVLVAGQPLPRLLRRGQAQEDRSHGRPGAEDLRRPDGFGRLVEPSTASSSSTARAPTRSTASRRREERPPSPSSRTRRARKRPSPGRSSCPTAAISSTWRPPRRPEDNAYRIGTLDSTETKAVAPAQTLVTYAPPGYLLFVRDKTLVAQRFDAKALKTTGEPVPLAEHVGTNTVGLARFSVSREGTLVVPHRGIGGSLRLGGRSRAARSRRSATPGDYHNPAFSPGGDRLAYDLADPRSGKPDIWVRDLKRGVSSRFTFGPDDTFCPLWSPDGRTVVYTKGQDLFAKPADGRGEESLLFKSDELKFACDFTRDGSDPRLSSSSPRRRAGTSGSLPMSGENKPVAFPEDTVFQEADPGLSPDGRYLAYQSNESGRNEVYVQSFPGPGGKWQISTAGGVEPKWRAGRPGAVLPRPRPEDHGGRDSRRATTFTAGIPRALFQGRFDMGVAPGTAISRRPTASAS